MRTKEGAPAGQAESPNSPAKDHHHVTTARAFAHGTTVSDALAWTVFTLVVGVILIAACVLLTLGWPS